MNRFQITLLTLATVLLALWIFPPWKREVTEQVLTSYGKSSSSLSRLSYSYTSPTFENRTVTKGYTWAFRFSPPSDLLKKSENGEVQEIESTWAVDQTTLITEMLVMIGIGIFVIVASRRTIGV
jgi:hypothetical protein